MKNIPIRQIKTVLKDPNFAQRFNIRNIETLLAGKDMLHELHRHDFFFVLALHKGKGYHEIDFTNYDVTDNSIFLLRPGQVHKLELSAGSTGFLMEFDKAFYQPTDNVTTERLKRAINKTSCKLEVSRFDKLLSALTRIFNEFSEKSEGYIGAICANLDIFFIEYIRESRSPDKVFSSVNTYTQERFDELLTLLEANIATRKKVSQYAELLNLSSYQLNTLTKAAVGKTASDIINEQIILEAKRYLLATSNQVKDIAYHLGYEDISYFIRFFKKQTNYSPEAFRQNFK